LLGPNGAGKTTTISMMLGVLAPSAGRIEVLGKEIPKEKAVKSPGSCKQVRQPTRHSCGGGFRLLRLAYSLPSRPACASAASCESVVVHTR
jgi:ABC-2 type transport system ATP-binding protein